MKSEKITIQEAREEYEKIYGESCSNDEATALVYDFAKFRTFIRKSKAQINKEIDSIGPKTINEFIKDKKNRMSETV